MKEGIVKFFNHEKGFGFITDNESGKDFFVHKTSCIDTIADGDTVSFEVGEGKKGPMATDVRKS